MADIIAFPARPESAPDGRYRSEGTVGSNAGISVRILSRVATPHDLLVVLHGTADGCTTIAAVPAGERAVADVIAHSTLATLMAAETTWRQQSGAAQR